MTDKKISELPTITGANLTGLDLIPVVDVSSNATSKVTRGEFFNNIDANVAIGTANNPTKLTVSRLGGDPSNIPTLDAITTALFHSGAGSAGSGASITLLGGNTSNTNINFADVDSGFSGRISYTHSSDAMLFYTTGFERMRIASNGNVGIGTTSPTYPLHVSSTFPQLFLGKTDQAGLIRLARGLDGNAAAWVGYTSATESNELNFFSQGGSAFVNIGGQDRVIFRTGSDFVNATERMRITSAGNVGIGTLSPSNTLDVNGSIIARTTLTALSDLGVSGAFNYNGASTFFIRSRLNGGTVQIGTETPAGTLYYPISIVGASGHTAFNTPTSEAMRITSTGLLGIGTASPQRTLHIAATEPGIVLQETDQATDESRWRLYMTGSDLVVTTANDVFNASEAAYRIARGDGIAVSAHFWYTDNNERMRITSTGNVGIGTSAPSEKLEVTGNVILDAPSASLKLKSGITGTEGTVQWTFNTESTVYASVGLNFDDRATEGLLIESLYPITLNSGNQYTRFFTSGSEVMRITPTGRVGIGTSNPGSKLSIVGLPTSSAGLSAGDIWNDGGTLKIV